MPSADVGGGNNNDGIKGNGGGGGGGGGGGSEGDSGPGAAAAALLASVGKSLDAIPSDMQAKVVSGLIPLEILQVRPSPHPQQPSSCVRACVRA